MIEEMKLYFKGNDLKIKKVLENSESYSEDAKKMRILLQEIEKTSTQTNEKMIKVKLDSESNYFKYGSIITLIFYVI